jgi:rare lipoprotein A
MRVAATVFAAALYAPLGLAQTPPQASSDASDGVCVYYARSHNGHITAGGDKFDSEALTAAHRKYPIGTKLKVTNLANSKAVIVRVNDRGPFTKGRDLSVTRRAARELGFLKEGIAKVRIEPVQ